jgi:hypothetical protein
MSARLPCLTLVDMHGESVSQLYVAREVYCRRRLAGSSPVILGRARWARKCHIQIGLAQVRHGPKIHGSCLAHEALWAVLGPLLQPVGRHDSARESAWPVKHSGPHDPIVARPTNSTTHYQLGYPYKNPPCGPTAEHQP